MQMTWCCYRPQKLGYGNYYLLARNIVRSEHAIIYNCKKSIVLKCKNRATLHAVADSGGAQGARAPPLGKKKTVKGPINGNLLALPPPPH